jgi:uncharacterized membrane protein
MLIVFTVLWWSILIGGFNTILRARGFTYGGTPRKTALFYILSIALTLVVFAPLSLSWSFVEPLHILILAAILAVIAGIDWEIAQTYAPQDCAWVWNSTLVKYTDVLFQQLLIFLLFTSCAAYVGTGAEVIALFASIFCALHLPVFFAMPRTIAWTFFLASLCGGTLFPILFIYTPMTAPFVAFSIHTLFYSILRAFEHHSDMWVSFIERD